MPPRIFYYFSKTKKQKRRVVGSLLAPHHQSDQIQMMLQRSLFHSVEVLLFLVHGKIIVKLEKVNNFLINSGSNFGLHRRIRRKST